MYFLFIKNRRYFKAAHSVSTSRAHSPTFTLINFSYFCYFFHFQLLQLCLLSQLTKTNGKWLYAWCIDCSDLLSTKTVYIFIFSNAAKIPNSTCRCCKGNPEKFTQVLPSFVSSFLSWQKSCSNIKIFQCVKLQITLY